MPRAAVASLSALVRVIPLLLCAAPLPFARMPCPSRVSLFLIAFRRIGLLHESLGHLLYKWLKIASGRRSRPNGAPGTRGRFGIAPLIDGRTQ